VPAVIDQVELEGMTAVLLQRLPAQARALGRACGSIYARLSTVPGPAPLPPAPAAPGGRSAAAVPRLDLHPLNILVSGTEVTGVLDWANAAAGDPVLDRARSWAILTRPERPFMRAAAVTRVTHHRHTQRRVRARVATAARPRTVIGIRADA